MHIKSRILLSGLFFLFVLFLSEDILLAELWASKTSNRYHNPSCKWAKKIKKSRLIKFETIEDATNAGYVPCKHCKPLSQKKTEYTGEGKDYSYEEWFDKGCKLSETGDYQGAANAFSKSIEKNTLYAKGYYNRGLAYAKTGKYHKAIDDFNKTVELNPQYAMAYINRGVVHLSMKSYEKADEDFDRAIEIDPIQRNWAYYNKACLFSLTKKVQEACNWLKKAIEEGYKNWDHINADTDLDNIRNTECFKNLKTLKN
ncbi:MAG TPA: tetratricopeptide repeat protein [Syntrophorhabdaceae bacterium]|jgi:tetratricopeptide (TPR) repeat protein|nr:tetratricopeptide repeat protein [Syntrophorhabdaceae bacterium]MDI9560432.1 tetratricopeptide repeat protein [Pseudomonadota bacterium]OQC48371.1 MAG: TPR repeat-containing protein YrrB [Deltaproteobacteria bacterium ADurb.Bin026]MBV6505155.1 hypothetical protein [Syntrophorhabdaceae bacterium]HNZ58995.1 tetratricopeptide repeat protein [Syntrophorhabdaceae bacterium]